MGHRCSFTDFTGDEDEDGKPVAECSCCGRLEGAVESMRKVEWSYWPQFKHYTITRTQVCSGEEDEVVSIALSIPQARKFAHTVLDRLEPGTPKRDRPEQGGVNFTALLLIEE